MSRLSEALKKIEKEISRASKKTGIRQLISKNRRLLTGAALGGGVLPLAGGLVGLLRDKRKKKTEAKSLDLRRQLTQRGVAGAELDKQLQDLIGPPKDDLGLVEPPINDKRGLFPPGGVSLNPTIDPRQEAALPPELRDLLPNAPVELNRPQGGLNLGSTGAGQDEAKILAEAELAKKLQEEQFAAKKAERAASLKALSELLTKRGEREFEEITPSILEDLNTRGLLRSSALGDRFAKEKGRIEARAQEQLGLQALADRAAGLQESTGILDQFLGARQGGLQRRFSLEDFARQTQAAKLLGQATAPIQPFQSKGKGGTGDAVQAAQIIGSGVGAGASLATKGGR